jgi:hypothetical protein
MPISFVGATDLTLTKCNAMTKPDIVERLRDGNAVVLNGLFHAIPAMREATDDITALRSRVEDLTKALKLARKRIEHLGACGTERDQEANETYFFPPIDHALSVPLEDRK